MVTKNKKLIDKWYSYGLLWNNDYTDSNLRMAKNYEKEFNTRINNKTVSDINEFVLENAVALVDYRNAPVKRVFKIDVSNITDEDRKKYFKYLGDLKKWMEKLDR